MENSFLHINPFEIKKRFVFKDVEAVVPIAFCRPYQKDMHHQIYGWNPSLLKSKEPQMYMKREYRLYLIPAYTVPFMAIILLNMPGLSTFIKKLNEGLALLIVIIHSPYALINYTSRLFRRQLRNRNKILKSNPVGIM